MKSAHDHLRCNIITSMEKRQNKKLAYPSSKMLWLHERSCDYRREWSAQSVFSHVINEHVFQPKQKKESVCMRIEFNSRRIRWDTNIAPDSLFGDISMAAVTSRENALCRYR